MEVSLKKRLRASLKKAAALAAWPALGVGLWIAAGRLGLVGADHWAVGALIIGLVLYVAAIPLSVLARLHVLRDAWEVTDPEHVLLVLLAAMLANFLLIGAVRALLPQRAKPPSGAFPPRSRRTGG